MINDTGRIIVELIESCGHVGSELREIVEKACVRTLDSRMIIEGKLRQHVVGKSDAIPKGNPIGERPFEKEIRSIIEKTNKDGIGLHFSSLVTCFFSILMSSTTNKQLVGKLDSLIERGRRGSFLMTDRGGPAINTWISQTVIQGDIHNLTIDKLHGLNAPLCDFAAVIVRNTGSLFPAAYLLNEEKYADLEKKAVGDTWFDGHVQLGNVKGKVTLSESDRITDVGLAPVAKFLSICRPRMIRVALSHLEWLFGQGRLMQSGFHQNALTDIAELAESHMRLDPISPDALDRVYALKFAFNELLLDIVLSDAVKDLKDKRDLLGFTKIEGSSYRCFLEIMTKKIVR